MQGPALIRSPLHRTGQRGLMQGAVMPRRPAAPRRAQHLRSLRIRRLDAQASGKGPAAQGPADIDESRRMQIDASKLLMLMLEAPDAAAVAKEHADSLDNRFFMVGATYLEMARKEGNSEVVGRLEAALRAAMDAKNATLRPEIQLLNNLLACEGDGQRRRQLLNTAKSGETLQVNDGYFFRLLAQMTADVARQPDNPRKSDLLAWLEDIKQAAEARLRPKT